MTLKIVLYLFIMFCVTKFSEGLKAKDSGVCEARISETKTRLKSFIVVYRKICGGKRCTGKKTKIENYKTTKTKLVCCGGYEYRSETDSCLPLCSTGCHGGRCVAPDRCVCDLPAILNELNVCVEPVCDPPCINATCTNNTCVCTPNYTPYNTTHCYNCEPGFRIDENFSCSPVCASCVNGNCTAPNTCTCLEGFTRVDEFRCEPRCESCTNARCLAPDTCECFPGYEKINGTDCVPKCDRCVNGDCVGPNICNCDEGYRQINGDCEPVCASGCVNGVCSAPEFCECNEGYVGDEAGQCVKICTGDDREECVSHKCRIPM